MTAIAEKPASTTRPGPRSLEQQVLALKLMKAPAAEIDERIRQLIREESRRLKDGIPKLEVLFGTRTSNRVLLHAGAAVVSAVLSRNHGPEAVILNDGRLRYARIQYGYNQALPLLLGKMVEVGGEQVAEVEDGEPASVFEFGHLAAQHLDRAQVHLDYLSEHPDMPEYLRIAHQSVVFGGLRAAIYPDTQEADFMRRDLAAHGFGSGEIAEAEHLYADISVSVPELGSLAIGRA